MSRTLAGNASYAAKAIADGREEVAESHIDELRHLLAGRSVMLDRVLARAVAEQMTICSFGQAKALNRLYEFLLKYESAADAAELVAEAFARRAATEQDVMKRSRLYKLAHRMVGIEPVARAFVLRGIRVYCPKNSQHPVDEIGAWAAKPVQQRMQARGEPTQELISSGGWQKSN